MTDINLECKELVDNLKTIYGYLDDDVKKHRVINTYVDGYQ